MSWTEETGLISDGSDCVVLPHTGVDTWHAPEEATLGETVAIQQSRGDVESINHSLSDLRMGIASISIYLSCCSLVESIYYILLLYEFWT